MNIWNKVFVGLIIVVSFVFFYFGALVLKTHDHWRSSAKAHEEKIAALNKEIETLRYGDKNDPNNPGLMDMESAVYKALIGRGRVWTNCKPQMVNPQEGQVRVTTVAPSPHGITDKTVLAVFDEREPGQGGRYIGRFVVTEVADNMVGLVPSRPMRPAALKRLAASSGTWTLCETVPSDNHDIFAGMTQQELEKILPKATLEEYLKDGKDDYKRKLRDYRFLFDTFSRQRAMMLEAYNSAAANESLMQTAVADAKVQVQFRQNEITELRKEVAEMTRQRDIVLAHQKTLESEIAEREKAIEEMIESNRELAGQIAKDQLEASRRVDIRTASLK